MSSPDVLVVGGSGFVGRHLVKELQAMGQSVASVGSRGGDHRLDIGNRVAVDSLIKQLQPRSVVHLAAVAHRGRNCPPEEYERVNHRGAVNVLEASLAAGTARLVLLSTALVYGDASHDGPFSETAPLAPTTAYSRSKARADEAWTKAIDGGARIVVYRPPAIYSPEWLVDVRKRAYVPATGGRILLRITGASPVYSLCSVQNVVDAVVEALGGSVQPGCYNVADAVQYRQPEVARIIGIVDGVRASIPIRRSVGTLASRLSGAVPGVGSAIRSNLDKLFAGFVLNTTRLERFGLTLSGRLHELVEEAGKSSAGHP